MKTTMHVLLIVCLILSASPIAAQLKAGDIHPNAVYVDAEFLNPFNQGAAVIRKGNATAMIDATGKIIIPYNKFDLPIFFNLPDYRSNQYNILGSGLFVLLGGQLINSKAQVLYSKLAPLKFSEDGAYVYNDNVPASGKEKQNEFYTRDGRKLLVTGQVHSISEGMAVYNGGNGKWGFKNIEKNQAVTAAIYDHYSRFSEGLARVGKYDEYGVLKYGFIDNTGKTVVPLIYTNEPSLFQGGLAKVIPKDKNEFDHGYINKNNQLVVKISKEDDRKYGTLTYAGSGLYVSARYVMDSTGKIQHYDEFLKPFGLQHEVNKTEYINLTTGCSWDDGKVKFMKSVKFKNTPTMGMLDLKSKKVIEPVFSMGSERWLGYFDSVAKLAYVKMAVGKDANGTVYREGYINEQGVFMIVKGAPASKW